MNRISRKVAVTGAAAVLALAGIGGVIGHTAVHAGGQPEAGQVAPDTDAVQQSDQTGSQLDQGGVDGAETGAASASDTDAIQSQSGDQSQLDTP